MINPLKSEKLANISRDLFQEVADWIRFLYYYTRKKLIIFGGYFEKTKDFIVDLLLIKRGRYSKHFLNISFIFLVAGAVIGGPVIADNFPTVRTAGITYDTTESSESATLTMEDLSTTTVISDKPRFDIIDYEVVKGDTLALIADKFGISVDTIKWVNSLKTEKLMPAQILKIPPVTGMVHKAKPGDTVYSIAKKYKAEAQNIVNFPANDFADLDTFSLNVGQIVFVPDGVMPEAAPIFQKAPVPQFIAGVGGKFIWPTQGLITQNPVSYHMAVDIANASAPPVAAGDAGVVSFANCQRYGYGCHVIIKHPDGYETLYAHLSAYYVSVGDKVGRGQVIGKMGSTGRSTGTHLHFEVRRNGVLLNPLSFLK
ncbi:M23 family metallopeptidase [Candidatus Gottesmanbacteria bacterium]|nr:M23 family metallopeptidase [Candidatus Gottesmanbacteria bacterium]